MRAAESVATTPPAGAGAIGGAIAALTSDDPRLLQINNILDEKVRPALMGDGGDVVIIHLPEQTLKNRYQSARGTLPRLLSAPLMAIKRILGSAVGPPVGGVAFQ